MTRTLASWLLFALALILAASAIGGAQETSANDGCPSSPAYGQGRPRADSGNGAATGTGPANHPSVARALQLSRACWVESGFREADCAAIAFVIARRAQLAGVSFGDMLWRYSALSSRTPRARFARSLPWGNHPEKPDGWNASWQRLREHAAAVLRGEVADPCPRAAHWGSGSVRVDRERAARAISDGRWARVRCREVVVNRFYRVRGLRVRDVVLVSAGGGR